MAGRSFTGNIFHHGKMEKMTVVFEDDGVSYSPGISSSAEHEGTLIPAFVNSHTHIGDSFISDLPPGGIEDIVGPTGFKHRMLDGVDLDLQGRYMKNTIEFMRDSGTIAFLDFREAGVNGVRNVPEVDGIRGIILGRTESPEEVNDLLNISSGICQSSISDLDFEKLTQISSFTRIKGKMFAIHFSERIREDVDRVIELEPSLLVHCIESSEQDLKMISERNIPVAITPRSNAMFGKNIDYTRLSENGLNLLLGTDNCMAIEPDMFSEMAFLYLHQRSLKPMEPEYIISIATESPQQFLRNNLAIDLPSVFIFFPKIRLTPYEIVTKGHMWKKMLINSES